MAEDKPKPDWEAVRADYEGEGGTLDAICARHGISRSALSWRAKHHLWSQRNRTGNVDRPQIIKRMFRLLEMQLIQLEKDMTQTGDKEVAVLGKLASTLEKLIEIDNAAAEKPKPTRSKEIHDLRNKLAQRIEQLKRA
ncbi:MAG TPA: hypothetical protein VL418_05500 [Devosiaceae bacterium]|nr:hypothetical protein [Devosiaceae bacterium]